MQSSVDMESQSTQQVDDAMPIAGSATVEKQHFDAQLKQSLTELAAQSRGEEREQYFGIKKESDRIKFLELGVAANEENLREMTQLCCSIDRYGEKTQFLEVLHASSCRKPLKQVTTVSLRTAPCVY
jgi:hypothetical protein